ncbi:MAG: hypothetical protein PHY57_03450 [Ignavibacterium sp.]|nr:MAG: hypothetical protein F9K42_08665 [Ignavibacterium sp.]MDX9712628.1 hypothetical protein [Ignavibacteriaceae bacterium]MEB2353851.1 hypothetical protein [Ignavibacteriales bacterium]GIK23024.1 MAG: hypothetical protein BroJett005_24380 [Ignavibacteriota bacterium]MBW7841217.1 hypothetical protein [Ignavibacterium sp.]
MKNFSNSFLVWSMFSFAMVATSLLFNISCSSSKYIPEKLETALQQEIRKYEKDNSHISIQFKGKTISSINEDMKSKLKEAGISIESVIGDIFTASGSVESIKKTTLLEFVVFLESAKQMDLKSK